MSFRMFAGQTVVPHPCGGRSQRPPGCAPAFPLVIPSGAGGDRHRLRVPSVPGLLIAILVACPHLPGFHRVDFYDGQPGLY